MAHLNGIMPLLVDKELNKSVSEEINDFGGWEQFIFTASLHLFTKSLLLQKGCNMVLTKKAMSMWLLLQLWSSVISAGFKYSWDI